MGQGRLFRQEVIENLKHKQQGMVFQNHTLPHTNLAIWIFIITIGIVIFIIRAEFCETYNVSGFLDTDAGVAQIHPPQSGIITQSFVKSGQIVNAGDKLFIINTSYGDLSKEFSQQEFTLLKTRCKNIKLEISQKRAQLKTLQPLLEKKYITTATYQSKRNELSNLQQNLHQVHIDMLKLKKSLSYYIFAPINGTITNNIYKVGQYVNPNRPIMNILPTNNRLHAELFVPVAKSGFIQKGARVSLRYAAFPYLHYGVGRAKITMIGQTILTDADERKPLKINSPYYKIIAELDKQNIHIAGNDNPLTQGMLCNAIIYGHKKKLWQWIFEPIYNFYDKL